jgi:hypothetical protein
VPLRGGTSGGDDSDSDDAVTMETRAYAVVDGDVMRRSAAVNRRSDIDTGDDSDDGGNGDDVVLQCVVDRVQCLTDRRAREAAAAETPPPPHPPPLPLAVATAAQQGHAVVTWSTSRRAAPRWHARLATRRECSALLAHFHRRHYASLSSVRPFADAFELKK